MGKDQEAQEFLGKLDNDPVVGPMVDATSYFELEAEEYRKKGVVRCSYPFPNPHHLRQPDVCDKFSQDTC